MLSGGVCDADNVSDHDGREINLFSSIHQIGEALIHSISLIAPLTPGYNVLNNELEKQLVEWCHVPFLNSLWCFQPWLLTKLSG